MTKLNPTQLEAAKGAIQEGLELPHDSVQITPSTRGSGLFIRLPKDAAETEVEARRIAMALTAATAEKGEGVFQESDPNGLTLYFRAKSGTEPLADALKLLSEVTPDAVKTGLTTAFEKQVEVDNHAKWRARVESESTVVSHDISGHG